MPNIQPGDVVILKSGSPPMTVEAVEEGKAWCTWFDGSKALRHVFPLHALEPYDEPDSLDPV